MAICTSERICKIEKPETTEVRRVLSARSIILRVHNSRHSPPPLPSLFIVVFFVRVFSFSLLLFLHWKVSWDLERKIRIVSATKICVRQLGCLVGDALQDFSELCVERPENKSIEKLLDRGGEGREWLGEKEEAIYLGKCIWELFSLLLVKGSVAHGWGEQNVHRDKRPERGRTLHRCKGAPSVKGERNMCGFYTQGPQRPRRDFTYIYIYIYKASLLVCLATGLRVKSRHGRSRANGYQAHLCVAHRCTSHSARNSTLDTLLNQVRPLCWLPLVQEDLGMKKRWQLIRVSLHIEFRSGLEENRLVTLNLYENFGLLRTFEKNSVAILKKMKLFLAVGVKCPWDFSARKYSFGKSMRWLETRTGSSGWKIRGKIRKQRLWDARISRSNKKLPRADPDGRALLLSPLNGVLSTFFYSFFAREERRRARNISYMEDRDGFSRLRGQRTLIGGRSSDVLG